MPRRSRLILAVVGLLGFGSLVAAPTVGAAPTGDDATVAKAALLTGTDFPAGEGWGFTAPRSPAPPKQAACQPVEKAKAKYRRYRTRSPEFSRNGGEARADNTVYVLPSADDAKKLLAPYALPTEKTCLLQTTKQGLRDVQGAKVELRRVDTSDVGPGVGFSVTITAPNSSGGTDTVVLDAVAYRVGRVVAGFTFQSPDEPLDIQQNLVNASLGRIQQALRRG